MAFGIGLMTPDELHKMPKQVLATLFASAAREAVLRLLMTDPLRAYYQRQIEQATGLAIRAVQRELERLSNVGLVYRREEGNRIYYHVDLQFPLYDDLRSMVLKTASPLERFRGWAAMDQHVRQAFHNEKEKRILLVTTGPARPPLEVQRPFTVETLSSEEFVAALGDRPDSVAPFLQDGEDLLGRRDDILWRRIDVAGFDVKKAKGVA